MSKEIEYQMFRIIIGMDSNGEQQTDIADEDGNGMNSLDWMIGTTSMILVRRPVRKETIIVTLPEIAQEPVKVEIVA